MNYTYSNENEYDGEENENKRLGTSTNVSSNSDYRHEEVKRPKILSTIGSTNAILYDQYGDSRNRLRDSDVKDIKNDAFKEPEAIQRNKRLFGALMGHLGVAKRKLEVDSLNIEKQSALQVAVLQKNDLENRRLQLLQKEASTSYKAKEKALREIFKLRQRRTEITSSSVFWNEKFISARSHVLMTTSLPNICWLPSAHNSITNEMMARRAEKIAQEIAEHDLLDLTLTGQIDKELLSLEKYIATFGMNQKDLLNESSGLAVVPLGLEVADPISSCSGELSEYITRIHNRRADKSAGDDMHDDNEINSAVSRQNWGIDNEYSFGDRRESDIRQQQQGRQQQDYQYMPRILSGFPQDSSQNEYGYASNQRNIQQGYRQGNGRTPLTNQDKDNQSRSFSSQSSRKRRDASGSDVSYTRSAATLGDVEDGEESIECIEKSGEEIESRITTEFVGPHRENNIVGEEEYNPEEVADNEGRFKMEEDEAELLLAALGGRKH